MMMNDKEYKELSKKEFSKAARVYETDKGGIYKMCRKDYPDIPAELGKEDFTDLPDCGCGPAPMLTLLHEKYPEKMMSKSFATMRGFAWNCLKREDPAECIAL